MAAAAAATAILVLFDGAIFSTDVFIDRFELFRMTASTVRRVCYLAWIIVTIDTGTDQASVAAAASGISSVITRIVAARRVLEAGGRPAIGGMAYVTLFSRAQMIDGLEGRAATVNMTLVTVSGAARIMRPRTANEGCRGMTEVAIQRGCNVCRVGFGVHADCRSAIMTGRTIVHNAGVIEYRTAET
jgi:hypothetical protein